VTVDERGVDELRRELVDACRILAKTGCVREITGNVSARIPGTNDVLLRFDDAGRRDELALHSEIYQARPEVNAIVHGHPRASLLCGLVGMPFQALVGAYDPGMLTIAANPPPVFPRSVPITTPELGKQLVQVMGNANTCLLRGHGIVTTGASVPEAAVRAIKLDALAELTLQIHDTGLPPAILPQLDIDETLQSWLPREIELFGWVWEFYLRTLDR
jgi:ribulose-5-phosphate 4-epimerase/fuculose-1-phosphate aldolase